MNVIFIALCFLYFSTMPEYGVYLQIIGCSLFILLSIFLYITNAPRSTVTFEFKILGLLLPLASLMMSLIYGAFDSIVYTIFYFFVVASIFKIIKSIHYLDALKCFIYFFLFVSCSSILLESSNFISALSFATDEFNARVRFSPFGMHPNLVGHIFGCAFLLSLSCIKSINSFAKISQISLMIILPLSFLLIISSGSRGASFAILISTLIYLSINLSIRAILMIALIFLMPVILFGNNFIPYLTELFELSSEYRGLDSGLSGRTDNWIYILSLSTASIHDFLLGHGLRSWKLGEIGIETDSSYINILWESGFFILVSIIYLLVKRLKLAITSSRSILSDINVSLILFFLLESIVARYLIGIGNPATIIFMMILLTPLKKSPPPKST